MSRVCQKRVCAEWMPGIYTWFVYRLTIETTFFATHALLIQGERETRHGHDWHVTVEVEGEKLDEDGLLCDFHELERLLEEVVRPMRAQDLHKVKPFDKINPSAEQVARHIADSLNTRLISQDQPCTVRRVTVTEAPHCHACYIYPQPPRTPRGLTRCDGHDC